MITSKTEDALYGAFNRIGLYPERQYPISKMHVDFAFPEHKLVIEVDGHYKRNPEGMQKLFRRRDVAENLGWRVKHYTAEEVYNNPLKVAWEIKRSLNNGVRKKEPSLFQFRVENKIIKPEDTMSFQSVKGTPRIVYGRNGFTFEEKRYIRYGRDRFGESIEPREQGKELSIINKLAKRLRWKE